ncbi:hypothetical protein AV530_001831 [Patagioenas fasciata monilis]|uniref:Uncharacterized protein n=1 Tax=Patagioenas fasciata monilis TaxID=372326 RepID=A0A1V4JSI6_PATFA|nr:hypothetical protein AV530_001831 [Patagioenas fasciata monilis]
MKEFPGRVGRVRASLSSVRSGCLLLGACPPHISAVTATETVPSSLCLCEFCSCSRTSGKLILLLDLRWPWIERDLVASPDKHRCQTGKMKLAAEANNPGWLRERNCEAYVLSVDGGGRKPQNPKPFYLPSSD